jgi:hypothetical protein
MKFVKILEETSRPRPEERFIDADKIKYIEQKDDRKCSYFDDDIYKTRIRMYGDEKEYDIIVPVEIDLVIAYLNNEEDFAALKNYKIPKPEAPEDLKTWAELRGMYSIYRKLINTLIKNNINTKSDLVQFSEAELLAIHGISKNGVETIKALLDKFGLELRDEEREE